MRKPPDQSHSSAWSRNEAIWDILFAAPGLLLIGIFILLPLVMALEMSLTNQRLVSGPNSPTHFIGFQNYARLITDDPDFIGALKHTFIFSIIVVPVETTFGLLLAVLVHRKKPLVTFFRSIYFAPFILPIVVVAALWTFFYASNEGGGSQGLFNTLLLWFSGNRLGPYDWLIDPQFVLPAIIFFSIWQGVGFQMVIYLAGLQEIPEQLYEASALDGASKLQQFWYVTLPLLHNATIFVLLVTTINAFNVFDQIRIMAPTGGTFQSATTIIYELVDYGFHHLMLGYASAIGMIFLIIVLFISLVERRMIREDINIRQ